MKLRSVWMLGALSFAMPSPAFANGEGVTNDMSASSAESLSPRIDELSQQQIRSFTLRMCTILHQGAASDEVKIPQQLMVIIKEYLNVSGAGQAMKSEIASFFNNYNSQMICPAINGRFATQHVFKRAIELNVYNVALLDFFFADPDGFPIDPNAIEVAYDGKMTTVLDYIDSQLAIPDSSTRFNVGEFIRMRRILQIRFGAKRAAEMTQEEIAFHSRKAPS